MKKLICLSWLFIASILSAQESNFHKSTSLAHQIQGDSTLTVILNTEGRNDNNQHLYVLVDSLNGDGTFTSTAGLSIVSRPRLKVSYAITTDEGKKTFYTSVNDSVRVLTSWSDSLAVGLQSFETDTLPEADEVQYELDFSAGDTLQVILINVAGKKSSFF